MQGECKIEKKSKKTLSSPFFIKLTFLSIKVSYQEIKGKSGHSSL